MTQSHDDFDIIALNGITGECLTTADQDDWCQRLKENPPDPLEEIRQENEAFLNDLEGLAVEALASGNWSEVYAHIATIAGTKTDLSDCFNSPLEYDEAIAFITRILGDRASTKSLTRSGADLLPTDQQNNR